MVLSGSKCVACYDPDTGKQIWIIDGPTEQFVASLVYLDGIFFITGGFPEYHVLGIEPDGRATSRKTHVLWRDKVRPRLRPLADRVGKYFFIVSDDGIATCFEAKTGSAKWKEQLGSHHSASPVAAGGYLYFPDDDGETYVAQGGATFELVAKNKLGEEASRRRRLARPIFIRTTGHLLCIGK